MAYTVLSMVRWRQKLKTSLNEDRSLTNLVILSRQEIVIGELIGCRHIASRDSIGAFFLMLVTWYSAKV